MQNVSQKLLIVCLVINTLMSCALFALGWKAYRGLERVENEMAKIEAFADEFVRDAGTAKEKAVDAYERYKEWKKSR